MWRLGRENGRSADPGRLSTHRIRVCFASSQPCAKEELRLRNIAVTHLQLKDMMS